MGLIFCREVEKCLTIISMKELDLEITDKYGPIGTVPASDSGSAKYYPTLHLEGSELDFPEDGTVTFEFSVKRRTESKNSDGSERCEYDLEIRKLKSVKAAPGEKDEQPYKRDTSAEDALDRLMKEREAEGSDDEGDEY